MRALNIDHNSDAADGLAGEPRIFARNGPERLESAIANRFMFTGRDYHKDLGIYDYRNRFYHPNLGRFMQSDPIGLQIQGAKLTSAQKGFYSPGGVAPEVFTSSELNLYRYCGNDPVNRTDPMGLLDTGGSIWNRLAWWESGSSLSSSVFDSLRQGVPITFTLSGNFSNADPKSHLVAPGSLGRENGKDLKGRTDAISKVTRQGNGLNANLHIDYYIVALRYDRLERQHTFGVEGGGSKTKGLLEAGGFWETFKHDWRGGISDFLGTGRFRLGVELESALRAAKRAQSATWDRRGGDHDVWW